MCSDCLSHYISNKTTIPHLETRGKWNDTKFATKYGRENTDPKATASERVETV